MTQVWTGLDPQGVEREKIECPHCNGQGHLWRRKIVRLPKDVYDAWQAYRSYELKVWSRLMLLLIVWCAGYVAFFVWIVDDKALIAKSLVFFMGFGAYLLLLSAAVAIILDRKRWHLIKTIPLPAGVDEVSYRILPIEGDGSH